MDMILVLCPEEEHRQLFGLQRHGDHDLIGLTRPEEHHFEYGKYRCPRGGSQADPREWDIVRAPGVTYRRRKPSAGGWPRARYHRR